MQHEAAADYIQTGGEIAGHIAALSHEPHNYVTVYVGVDDLQAYLDKSVVLGGKALLPVIRIPYLQFFLVCRSRGKRHRAVPGHREADRMIAARYIPRPPLADFVDQFWYWDANTLPHSKERLLPDGSMTLAFNLGQDRIRIFDRHDMSTFSTLRGQTFSGAHSSFFVLDTESMLSTVGVHFKPGGAFPFFRVSATELCDQCIAIDDLWGDAARSMRDRLLEPTTAAEKFRCLEEWLLKRLAKPLERHPAVDYAMEVFVSHHSALPVSTVAERAGYSQRRLIQLFSEQVGLTPKLFSRIGRFQRVIHEIAGCTEIDWAGIALSCGYFDQTHDFQQVCGLTPSAYIQHRSEHLNHVPVLD